MPSGSPSISHRVHGLSGESTAPDWPPLARDEIIAVLDRYALGTVRGTPWRSPRPLSAAVVVETDAARVFVKRHHRGVRDSDTLAEEHRFMAHLRARGIPVPAVLATRDGDASLAIGDRVYEVHAAATGRDLYRDTASWTPLERLDHARAAGAMLARAHRAAVGPEAPQRATHRLVARDDLLRADDPVAALEGQLPGRPGLAAYLARRDWRGDLARSILPRQQRLQAVLARQPRLWTHNDWHASNLCWDTHGEVSDVLDFGLASPTFALFDLATAIERNAVAWLALERGADAVHADTARALIEGYREVRALDPADLDVLAGLLPVVHLDFALSETEYFHAILRDTSRADLAYDAFLLGHAAWFDSTPARTLLEAIRDPA